MARQGLAGHGKDWQGRNAHNETICKRRGEAWHGEAWRGKGAMRTNDTFWKRSGRAWRCRAGLGLARQGRNAHKERLTDERA